MTTGRINQVAFLGDTTTRTTPDADETRGRDGRGSRSYRARAARNGRSQGRRPRRRHRILHPKARAIARGPVRRESARLEHGRRCWARPAPPGRRAAERDSFTFEFHRSGYAAQEPRLAARHPGGLGPRVMGAAGRQFGAQARSLPTRTAQLPLMRLCVHATTIPTSEPRTREQVETPERDRARTAGREGSRRDKQQGTRQGQTCGGPSAQLGRRRPGLGIQRVTS